MKTVGEKYDTIAAWWNQYHFESEYGVAQLERALSYAVRQQNALDVGCGSGGRLIRRLQNSNFTVTGLDASSEMIKLAKLNHPDFKFIQSEIQDWETDETFDFILSWDCLFHLPLSQQKPVLSKLCDRLNENGILIYSFGDAVGDKNVDEWRGQEFRYSSIGIFENTKILTEKGLSILHLELDQFPEKHVYIIAAKAAR
jgi:SAM-dependent methyltransferase